MATKPEPQLKAEMKEALNHLFYTDLVFAELSGPPRTLEATRLRTRVEEACERAVLQDGMSAEQVRHVLRIIGAVTVVVFLFFMHAENKRE